MDETRAKNLLETIFNSKYSHENYENFIVNLLNNVKISRTNYNSFIIGNADFENFVQIFDFFGTYQDPSGKTADILSVKLTRDNSKIRARVKQRNIIANWLKKSNHNCALVAFYDDTEDWRFSFVELEYKTGRVENGQVRDFEQLSPARRLSFLVGKNEPNHTCKKYLLELVKEDSKLPDLSVIRSAFSIESVSKEFFEKYKGLYDALLRSLKEVIAQDEVIKKEFIEKNIDSSEFAKKLLGQIVFIYFLQKKGWLGVPRKGKWGEGRKDFLRAVFEGKFGKYDNFFNDVLEPLFYNAFANSERDNAYYDKFDCRIPFLNGGLFEPVGGYDWVNTDIVLENGIFKKIFDTFDEFNFTIKEDEPLEKEVAVDPEMLGKIFENLLEENLRKGYGAFYTPREIVHYMCQETLVNYLTDNSSADRDVIDALIRKGNAVVELPNYRIPLLKHARILDKMLADIRIVDPAVGSGAFPVGLLSEIVNARLILGELAKNKNLSPYDLKRATIENCLYGVDIDAGAVDIAKLRFWLALVIDEDNEDEIEPLPNLEQKIMCGDSLLESFKGIRLFDESIIEKSNQIKFQIEEIDNQIVVLTEEMGVTEFGKDPGENIQKIEKLKKARAKLLEQKSKEDQITVLEGSKFGGSEARQRLKELRRLQGDFFDETIKSKKEKLRKEIDHLEWRFIEDALKSDGHEDTAAETVKQLQKNRSKPFFLWKLYFSDVFAEKGGFDIVIGNPPYVQIQKMKEEYKSALQNEGYDTFTKRGDLYCLFYERGFEISREGGQTALITSNQWMRAAYGDKTRKFFKQNSKPLILMDFSGQQMFETATVDTNILIFAKEAKDERYEVPYAIAKGDLRGVNLSEYVKLQKNNVSLNELKDTGWVLADIDVHDLKRKIAKIGVPLKEWDIKINFGLKTGFNDAYIIDEDKRNELITKDPKCDEIIKPILRGRDIQKYFPDWAGLYLLFVPWHFPLHDNEKINGASAEAENAFKKEYPSIYEHLAEYKSSLTDRNQAETGIRYEWYALQRCAATYWKEFSKDKIVWKRIGSILRFSYSTDPAFCLDSTCIATGKNIKYLTAILNSKMGNYLLKDSPKTGMGDLIISVQALDPIPVPNNPPEEVKRDIEEIVDQIIMIKSKNLKSDISEFENRIDKIVYKLYNLTDDEIAIVEKYNN